jgi:hypothetical protein
MDILKKEICFLSKDKIYYSKNEKKFKKDLILSPYYYWYFVKKLPISNVKRAKVIVSQMLESSLPQNKQFEYILKEREKEKKTFDVYIVDQELLVSKLHTFGIKKEMISSISFSHIELEESCLELDHSFIIHYENNVAEIDKNKTIENTLLNLNIKTFLKDKEKIDFKYAFSKGDILQKTLELLESNFKSVAIILGLFFVSQLIDIVTLNNKTNLYDIKQSEVLKSQTYATHSIQLKYVMDEVLQLDFKQKNLKNSMNNILKIKGNTTTHIAKIEYDDGDWFLDIVAPNKEKAEIFMKNKNYDFVGSKKSTFKYEKVK